MELAVFFSKIESLQKFNWEIPQAISSFKGVKFSRLYFGQEFCERLIFSKDALKKAMSVAEEKGLLFTLVTPYVTEKGLITWGNLASFLLEQCPTSEVVINDFGLFYHLKDTFPKTSFVLGRLLTKQKRGPRILRLKGNVPEETISHFMEFNADVPHLANFYKGLGFCRYELDNTLQGIKRQSNVKGSLYFPYLYVSTTRMCLTNQSNNRTKSMRAIFPCKKECQKIRFYITHDEIPTEVILSGNTQFIKNEKLPENLEELNIDRIVYMPEIPI